MREEPLLPLHGLLFPVSSKVSFICTILQTYTKAFFIPNVEHWLEQEIAPWVHYEGLIWWPTVPWADDLLWSYISLLSGGTDGAVGCQIGSIWCYLWDIAYKRFFAAQRKEQPMNEVLSLSPVPLIKPNYDHEYTQIKIHLFRLFYFIF